MSSHLELQLYIVRLLTCMLLSINALFFSSGNLSASDSLPSASVSAARLTALLFDLVWRSIEQQLISSHTSEALVRLPLDPFRKLRSLTLSKTAAICCDSAARNIFSLRLWKWGRMSRKSRLPLNLSFSQWCDIMIYFSGRNSPKFRKNALPKCL
jgi:hypothetical protein